MNYKQADYLRKRKVRIRAMVGSMESSLSGKNGAFSCNHESGKATEY